MKNSCYSVSVIIPVWNAERTLKATIDSVLNQTIDVTEVLVCDDGSTDSSEEIVKNYSDSRVKWLTGRRGGRPAIPRNIGINNAKCDWLAFIDSDDVWLPNKLEKQFIQLNQLGCNFSSTNATRFVPGTGNLGRLIGDSKNVISFQELLIKNIIVCSSVVVKNELVKSISGFPEDPELIAIEDYALWLRLLTQTGCAFVNDELIIYRDEPLNSIRKHGIQNPFTQKRIIIKSFIKWAILNNVENKYIKHAKRYKISNDAKYLKSRVYRLIKGKKKYL